jgi:flagellar biosynthetic protein FlhB
MADPGDDAQRTEEPTAKRLEEARRKGDSPRSQEVISFVALAAATLGLWLAAAPAATAILKLGIEFLEHPHAFAADGDAIATTLMMAAQRTALALGAFAALFVAAALSGNFVQAQPGLYAPLLKPDPKRISPLNGFKRIYGAAAIANFLKGLAKLALVGAIMTVALWPDRALLAGLPYAAPGAALKIASALVLKLAMLTLAALAVIASLDYAEQRRAWKKRLRMTKEEVRREIKESEGDPQIKARQRRIRETRARRRMLAAVKNATVLVMNPTHFAVALRYDDGSPAAPACVAKGLDELALRLRKAAEEAGVPVVENPPLARALYAAVDIDDEIPVEHYEAVAKLIGFVVARRSAKAPSMN